MKKKSYIKPIIYNILIHLNSTITCSCLHNCIGTKCDCSCKGWTKETEEEFNDGSMLELVDNADLSSAIL